MAINIGTSSLSMMSGSEAPGHCHDLGLNVKDNNTSSPTLVLNWKDSYEGVWGGTKVIFKKTNPPRNEADGTLICNSTDKHSYSINSLEYKLPAGLTSGLYHVTLFPYSVSGIMNTMRATTSSIQITIKK